VSLQQFQDQVLRQRITNEELDEAALRGAFSGLVVPEHYLNKIGPAINAGRTVLLFGPPATARPRSPLGSRRCSARGGIFPTRSKSMASS